jgi:hypothetical protein
LLTPVSTNRFDRASIGNSITATDSTCHFQFCSLPGQQYYIAVMNDIFYTYLMSVQVSVTSLGSNCVQYNGECSTAEPASFGNVLMGDTSALDKAVPLPSPACTSYTGSNNAWYSVTGTGSSIVAVSLSNDENVFITQLVAYKAINGCSQLVCVDSNSNEFLESSPNVVTFCTEVGAQYYVVVTSVGDGKGEYVVLINDGGETCTVPTNNCDYATQITSLPFSQAVDTTSAFGVPGFRPTCNSLRPSFKYEYFQLPTFGSSQGQYLTVDTCASDSYYNFDTVLAIYTTTANDCGAQTCVASNDDSSSCTSYGLASSVSFCAKPNTPYFAYVSGYFQTFGEFVVNAYSLAPCHGMFLFVLARAPHQRYVTERQRERERMNGPYLIAC